MTNVTNINDHLAFSCGCGSVKFSLLKSGGIECSSCLAVVDAQWGQKDSVLSRLAKMQAVRGAVLLVLYADKVECGDQSDCHASVVVLGGDVAGAAEAALAKMESSLYT